jgi:O-antigen/teichoic acid export membrane protein
MKEISNKIASGVAWMVLFKVIDRSIGLVSVLILARVLTPADFGLVAMAMSVVALIEMMGAFGFDTALIQRRDAERRHYDTAWTFAVLFGVATTILLLALSVPASEFFHEPRLKWILPVLAAGALIGSFENIGTVNFRKEMNFWQEFRFLVSKKIASFVVTVTLALYFRSFWALIAGMVTAKVCSVWISYRAHPYRPRFTLAGKSDLLHFSKWLFLSNFVLFLQNRADSFILGRTVGAANLGIYNVASEIAALPSTELIAPINRAVFPAYSHLAADLSELRNKFLTVFGTIAVLAFPVSIGLACVAAPAVQVLLGPQWTAAIPLLQLFTVCGLASALQSNLILVIVALGKPKVNTLMSGGMLILYLPAVIVASINYGVLGAAWTHLVMSVLVLIPLHIVFLRLVELPATAYFGSLWRPCVASVVMAAVILALQAEAPYMLHSLPIVELITYVLVGALSYVIALLALWYLAGKPENSAESSLLSIATQKLRPLTKAYP